MSPRRTKALRQGDRGQDRQRKNKRRRDWDDRENRQSRFRDSWEDFSDFNHRGYHSDRFPVRKGPDSKARHFGNRRDFVEDERCGVDHGSTEFNRRSVGGSYKFVRFAAICVRKIDNRQAK